MLRVTDLLSLPQFETFKLITDADGLHNIVSGAGILDWESPKEIVTDFSVNDFVLTTLYMSRDNLERADTGLKALIKHRVSAIGLKTIYSETCSREVIELANLYKIPIFTYQDAYLEDLIYIIKSSVFANNSNDISLDYLKFLMEGSEDKIVSTAKKLNPLFCDHLMCCCCIPTAENVHQQLDNALDAYHKTLPMSFPVSKSGDTFIRCNRCIMLIHTSPEEVQSADSFMQGIASRFGMDPSAFRLGFSGKKSSLADIRDAVDEAMTAAVSAFCKNEKYRTFDEIGSDMLILPNLNSKPFLEFYEKIFRALSRYDEGHSSRLIETLLCYIESEGDIALTARKMFQHGNTIRYRIDKIKGLLGIAASPDAYIQLYIYAQLHKLHEFFGGESIL